MAEFRRDPIVGLWVITETDFSWDADQYAREDNKPYRKETCQFCSGREQMTPPEVLAFRDNGSPANSSGWNVRVIPNKFPALRIEGELDGNLHGIFQMTNGVGAHEVLIESPEHDKTLADLPVEQCAEVIRAYQQRIIDLAGDKRFKYILIFKNHGESAGTSVEHPHSQIIALPMIPQYVLAELEGTQEYYDEYKRCVFCDMIKQEMEEKARLVSENESFLAFCPFVSRYPFETWIIPRQHSTDFTAMKDNDRQSLAATLKDVLSKIKAALGDPSFNYYLHVSPVNYEGEENFHWHIEIVPKLTQFSGFEWGTGFYVVRTEPSHAADILRGALVV